MEKEHVGMVIASVPLDRRHVVALWSELECFTNHPMIHKVIVSAPYWSYSILEQLIPMAQNYIPHFQYPIQHDVGNQVSATAAVTAAVTTVQLLQTSNNIFPYIKSIGHDQSVSHTTHNHHCSKSKFIAREPNY